VSLVLGKFFFVHSEDHVAVPKGQSQFIPHEGRLLIVGQEKNEIDQYVSGVGIIPAGLMGYTSIQEAGGLYTSDDNSGGVQHAQYLLERYPHTVFQLALYMVGVLAEIPTGKYDRNIQKLAEWIKQSHRPVYLRIGYEFDLPDNHYNPVEYKRAYRYIVDHLRKQKVTNVAYVWHSAVIANRNDHFMDWYPGDAYVAWFAISYFDPAQTKRAEVFAKYAREHKKPLMIAEATPAGMYTVKGKLSWFKRFFDFIEKEDVKVVSYINYNWDSYPMFKLFNWADARIQKNSQVKEMWLEKIQAGHFLQSSEGLFKKISYEP